MTVHPIKRALTALANLTSRPEAFLLVVAYAAVWLVLQPDSFDMHGLATLAVWVMTLVIRRAENGDMQAIHAKLDELIRSDGKARNKLATIDEEEPEDIQEQRKERRQNA